MKTSALLAFWHFLASALW